LREFLRSAQERKFLFVDGHFEDYRVGFFLAIASKGFIVICFETSSREILTFTPDNHEFNRRSRGFVDFWIQITRELLSNPKLVVSGNLGIPTAYCALLRRYRSFTLLGWCRLTLFSERNRSRLRVLARKFLVLRLDGVLVNGESGASYCKSLKARRLITLYQSSIDEILDCSNRKSIRTNEILRLVFVGRLISVKGLHEFLSSANSSSVKFELTIVGDGIERQSLEQLAKFNNQNVKFLGHKQRSEILDIFINQDALVMPSLGDEWGLVVIEAMSRGLPILGSIHCGAVMEFSRFANIGPTFDPFDPNATRAALENLSNMDEGRLRQIGLDNMNIIKKCRVTQTGMAETLCEALTTQEYLQ
jgi:glycosyltransferase involved in cell wall biosynthesis